MQIRNTNNALTPYQLTNSILQELNLIQFRLLNTCSDEGKAFLIKMITNKINAFRGVLDVAQMKTKESIIQGYEDLKQLKKEIFTALKDTIPDKQEFITHLENEIDLSCVKNAAEHKIYLIETKLDFDYEAELKNLGLFGEKPQKKSLKQNSVPELKKHGSSYPKFYGLRDKTQKNIHGIHSYNSTPDITMMKKSSKKNNNT